MVMDDDGADLAMVGKAKRAWYVRFGRTVTQQVVDAVQGRFSANPQRGLTLTVAGEDLTGTPLEENEGALAKVLGFETVTTGQVMQDSAFSFSPPSPSPTAAPTAAPPAAAGAAEGGEGDTRGRGRSRGRWRTPVGRLGWWGALLLPWYGATPLPGRERGHRPVGSRLAH